METEIRKRLGSHIRLESSILEVLAKAEQLQLPFFQCFLVMQTGGMINVTREEWQTFVKIAQALYGFMICHGSFWINLSSLGSNGYVQLRREMALAKRLEFTHLVLHAGTAKGATEKSQGINALARALNNLLKREQDIMILFENTCHGNLAIGSDILDFKQLLEKLDIPLERIGFCIDTAHAYSFGYDISSIDQQEDFIRLLDSTIGIERIKLIHLNDTAERLGSCIDKHSIVGQGRIGKKALHHFITHPQLQTIPLLMEQPEMPLAEEIAILESVRGW